MAQKGCFGPFWTLLGALWHTHMALPDPKNGSNATPGMCPDLFHPCSTLFHQFGTTRSAFGRKRPFLAVLDPVWQPSGTPRWPSLAPKTDPIHYWGCALTCSTLVSLCSTSLEPPDPLLAQKGRFWPKKAVFGRFGPCLAIYLAKMAGTRVVPIGTSQSLPKRSRKHHGLSWKTNFEKAPLTNTLCCARSDCSC